MLDDEELLQRAAFGKQVELFYTSRVGSYLRDRAHECYTTAIEQIKSVDPTDTKRVMALQNDIWKAEQFEKWLTEAMIDGFKSLEILESDGSDG